MGRGLKNEADDAATTAMRTVFDTIPMQGVVVIGEGEMDEAPMLYIGEKLGTGQGPEVDVAVDPVEGTNIVASGGWNALAVIAIADKGNLLNAPDMYMNKIAVRLKQSVKSTSTHPSRITCKLSPKLKTNRSMKLWQLSSTVNAIRKLSKKSERPARASN